MIIAESYENKIKVLYSSQNIRTYRAHALFFLPFLFKAPRIVRFIFSLLNNILWLSSFQILKINFTCCCRCKKFATYCFSLSCYSFLMILCTTSHDPKRSSSLQLLCHWCHVFVYIKFSFFRLLFISVTMVNNAWLKSYITETVH